MAEVKSALKEATDKSSGGVGVLQVYLFGLVIVIGGQYIVWNTGLDAGFYTFLFCTLFLGCGYVCLSLCLSEMIGILPFGGGAYGFARLTLGPTFGYLIGCCESIESILYVTAALVPLGKLITSVFNISSVFEPLWWFLFYVTALFIHISGNTVFWTFNAIMGVTVTVLVLVYCFGSIPHIDFPQYVTYQNQYLTAERDFAVRIFQMMKCLPLAGWWYVGVEGLPLVCSKAKAATTTVPRAIMLCVLTSVLTAVGILFCCSAQFPGVYFLAKGDDLDTFLLNYGFSQMFHISRRFAGALSIPAIYATAYGFMFIYGTQMSAMAKSGLFPKVMAATMGPSASPYIALITGSAIGFAILLVLRYVDDSLTDHLFNISMLGSFFVYMSTFTSYVIFKTKYTTLTRNFVNPLGMYSAYFGTFVFCVAFVAVAVFQEDDQIALGAFIVLIGLFVVYYYGVAKKRQFYSPDEQGILLITYIIKGNIMKKRRRSSMGATTPQITRSNQNTPLVQHREVPAFDFKTTTTPVLKEEDGVVPFSEDANSSKKASNKTAPGAFVNSSPAGSAVGVSVKPSSRLKRGDTFDPEEAADTVGELRHLYGGGLAGLAHTEADEFEEDEDDSFRNNTISVNSQNKQTSFTSMLFAARRKSAMDHWHHARGVVPVLRVLKPTPARNSALVHKRKPQMKYSEMLQNKTGDHLHHNPNSSSSSGDHKDQEDNGGAGRPRRILVPEHDEATTRSTVGFSGGGRRDSDPSARHPNIGGQRNMSHWFTSSRRVADMSIMGGFMSNRSSNSSSNSSMSRRVISRINSSLSSINVVNHVDTLVTAHHDKVVQNVINILPTRASTNFDSIVEAIVNRMLQEKDLDQEAFDIFLDSLGDTEEARLIALRYQEELARRGRKMIPPSPDAVTAAAVEAAAAEVAAEIRASRSDDSV